MPDPDHTRRNSIEAAPPFNRLRIVLAIIVFLIAIAVIAYRSLT